MSLSKRVIETERQRFKQYYSLCLEFLVIQNNKQSQVFLAGELAGQVFNARAVDHDAIVRDAKPLRIFSADAYATALDLLKFLLAKVSPNVPYRQDLIIYPIIAEVEYAIQIPTRRLVIVRNMGSYRDKKLGDLIRPPVIAGLALMSPEILLIDLYRRIFAADPDDRPALEQLEQALFGQFSSDAKRGELLGGGDDAYEDVHVDLEVTGAADKADPVIELRKLILAEFGDAAMIVGQQALLPEPHLNFLQLCTGLDDAVIRDKLQATTERWSKRHTIVIQRYHLPLPNDTNLKRFRLFIQDSKRVQVVDVFTLGQYDLYCQHAYVYLRFVLVDIWTIMLIHECGDIDDAGADRQIGRLMALCREARRHITPLADIKSFYGSYIDEGVLARRNRVGQKNGRAEIVYGALLSS